VALSEVEQILSLGRSTKSAHGPGGNPVPRRSTRHPATL
jgi:hypothetical protein